ncbi:zinc finger protein RFP-like [Pseudonaja textilis]|uniref:zinc finger protein RFP-like n=1 Tax=Pseudonaja textilis TaxID=8673 RepID=UPI000EAA04AA|nr:zinc finger protein RFP-like [Pseudonaja textilis]
MDTGKISEYLPDAATCTLCMRVFHEPVTLNCGHNYCHACIQKHWGGAQSNVACPQCHQRFDHVTLMLNRQLGNVAWLIRKLQDKGVLKKPSRGFCEAHKQLLTVFCQKDQALLCAECLISPDHTGHTLASLEGAAQAAKTKVRVFLDLLKIQKAHIRDSFSDARTEKENLEKMMDRENQKFRSGYKEMYELVKTVQLDQRLAAKGISEEIEEELARLAKNHSAVRAFAKGLEWKFEEPAYEFLMDIKEVMARCKELLAQPPEGNFPPYKEKMWDLSIRSLFVDDTLKRCKDALPLVYVWERANVTMDRLTAHPHLLLSASKKIVTHDATPSGLLPGRQAFDTTPCILAEKGFTGGRHCWQVEVASRGRGWAFGVMKDSVSRKGPVGISTDEGIWALLPEHLPPAEPELSICSFRLYLDYEGGTIHFFDGVTREPVALLSYAVFLGERVFPFFKLEEPSSQMCIVP